MKISLLFAWYDLYVGAYYNQHKRTLYVFLFPMIGIRIQFKNTKQETNPASEASTAFSLWCRHSR